MTTAAHNDFRRPGLRALAALEFRVGLYAWLTRVLPALPFGGLWASGSVICICSVALVAAAESAPPEGAGWLALALAVPGRLLILSGLAGIGVWSDHCSSSATGWSGSGNAAGRGVRPHLAGLLPLTFAERERAGALGRLASMAALAVPGMALMVVGWLIALSGGEPRPELREAAMWGLATLAIFALSRAERAFGGVRQAVSGAPGMLLVVFWVARLRGIPQSRPLCFWEPAAWIALLCLAVLAAQLVWNRVSVRAQATQGLLPAGPPTLLRRWPRPSWVADWARACTPEAGLRPWLRAMATVLAQVLGFSSVCLVLWPLVAVRSGRVSAADLAAQACFVVLPALGAGLSVAASTGGRIEARPRDARELLPLGPSDRWRALLVAGLVNAFGFAALGAALGVGGLAITAALTGAPATARVAMYWMPLIIPAAALIAWAQEPLTRYPFRLVPQGEALGWVLTLVMTLVVVPLALAALDFDGPWSLLSAIALWPTAAVVVLVSRLTAGPSVWDIDADGTVTSGASRKAHAVLLLSAASLALTIDCTFLAIVGAIVV